MVSKSKTQTQKFAAHLAKKILKAKVIALHGDLGAGKTTFVQGFLKALGVKQHITSPTFVIFRRYSIPGSRTFNFVYHFDLYRIHKPGEILDLGLKKIIKDPDNIVLIEWPEKIKKILPKNTIWVNFEHGKNQKERIINVR